MIREHPCKTVVLAVLCLSIFLLEVSASETSEKIGAAVQRHFEDGKIHGTVLVAVEGAVIFSGGVGMANYEWGIPNAPDTKFRLGSVTKQFTATLILQLVDEGKIDLQANLLTYLPDYRADTGEKITVHHLLNHTSGIPSYTGLPGFMKDKTRESVAVDEFVAEFCSGDLEFEPDEKWRYNNSGYFLLGAILEKVSGITYEELLRQRIFEPLGMHNSGYDHHDTILLKRAGGYTKKDDTYANADYLDMSIPYAAGSLYSTVEDMHKWDRALYEDTVLSEEMKKLMFTPYKNDYGYGWRISDLKLEGRKKPVKTISHGGGINGFATLITRDTKREILVVVLNNVTPSNSSTITKEIFEILYSK